MPQNGRPAVPAVGWRYRVVTTLLTPAVMLVSARLALRHRQQRYLWERMGWRCPAVPDRPIWFHAASVGEVLALKPILLELHSAQPELPILLTTVTPTGAEIAERHLAAFVAHRYLPWDTKRAARHFLDQTQPRCAVIMETELWPTLYAECARRGIAPLIINGRISARTRNAAAWLRDAYRAALANTAGILARSQNDAEGFLALGAADGSVRVAGNIKLAPVAPPADAADVPAVHPAYVLAASTHDDEELGVARRWLADATRTELLVIAPRHPQRGAALAAQLKTLTPEVAVRSRGETVTPATRIYLADTLGEMPWLMRHALLVVMGGSFVPRGGHNVLEPAHLGKAVITGPHMENFREETALLRAAGALRQANGIDELGRLIDELLHDTDQRRELEQAARKALEPFRNLREVYLEAIAAHCRCRRDSRQASESAETAVT